MKRINKYLILLLAVVSMSSCKDWLDREAFNILSNEDVFNDESGLVAYMATLYAGAPIEDFRFTTNFNQETGMGPTIYGSEVYPGSMTPNFQNSWAPAFTSIRDCNVMIRELTYNSTLDNDLRISYIAEARFLRGLAYLFLVKVWGGVPIFTEALEYDSEDLTNLLVPRDQEEDVYDFIIEDFEHAAKYLSEEKVSGRANKYVAYAFLAKAAMHAGSIALNATYQPYYYVGVTQTRAIEYYEKCIEAAGYVIDNGGYELYNKYSDKTENFQRLFLDNSDNSEVLLYKHYSYILASAGASHSYDYMVNPYQISYSTPTTYTPYLETLEAFEYLDGTLGSVKPMIRIESGDATNDFEVYETVAEAFAGRDYRMAATLVIPGEELKGEVISYQNGVFFNEAGYPGEETNATYSDDYKYDLVRSDYTYVEGSDFNQYYDVDSGLFVYTKTPIRGTGASGGASIGVTNITGLNVKKYMDVDRSIDYCYVEGSETSYIVMRYAEVLLNYVEAAIELGDSELKTKALVYINQIRSRAGLIDLTYDQLSNTRYRLERRSEFSCENMLFWDVRRWRSYTAFFDTDDDYAKRRCTLGIFYDYENDLYMFNRRTSVTKTISNEYQMDYTQIPTKEMSKNPYFVNNPGY